LGNCDLRKRISAAGTRQTNRKINDFLYCAKANNAKKTKNQKAENASNVHNDVLEEHLVVILAYRVKYY